VLLSPLLLLPIFLLFAFAGCQLIFPIEPVPLPLFTLKYPAGLKTDVISIKVMFSFTTETFSGKEEPPLLETEGINDSGGEIIGSTEMWHEEDLEGGWAEGDKVHDAPTVEEEADLTCECTITFTNLAGDIWSQTVGPSTQTKQAGNKPDPFKLSRDGDLFSLEHL
jgi:hypothetical protein